ncbi:MAG: phosphotransferase [Thermosynechococcaceae cyanobacterium]
MAFLLDSHNVLPYLSQLELWPSGQPLAALEPKSGKNFNLRVKGETQDLLIKQEPHGLEDFPLGELRREYRFYQLLEHFPELETVRSQTTLPLHFDADHGILVFPYLPNVADLSTFYRHCTTPDGANDANLDNADVTDFSVLVQPLPTQIASAIGQIFAHLHGNTFQQSAHRSFWLETCQEDEDPDQDETERLSEDIVPDFLVGLRRLTPESYCVLPTDALKFFRFYQHYPELGEAIDQLNQSFDPCCIVHDDPRFANFLIHLTDTPLDRQIPASIQLIDWEKWKWGDPAYDLGQLLANYLRLWLESLPVSAHMPMAEALNRATVPLAAVQPSAAALVTAYLFHFPQLLNHQPDFLVRLTQFTGLGLIRQVQLYIAHKSPIGNVEMAMAQVGKSLLCQPAASLSTVFGQTQETLANGVNISGQPVHSSLAEVSQTVC